MLIGVEDAYAYYVKHSAQVVDTPNFAFNQLDTPITKVARGMLLVDVVLKTSKGHATPTLSN